MYRSRPLLLLIDEKSIFGVYRVIVEMFREMIPIILLFLKIVLTSAQAQNDVQQSNKLPDGQICLFTCSEWIFQERIQQFAPSANLLGPGYLSKHKIGFPSSDPKSGGNDSPLQYEKVWGAVYSVDKKECDNVLKQSQSEYSVPFSSNEDVFVVKYEEMNCLVVDLGIQPGDHPPWRHFNMKIPNTIEDDAYFNRLAQIGVPQDYIKGLRNASLTPQYYHPIIPQDYHRRQIGDVPKRTYDQLPSARVHPNPHQHTIDNGPIIGQIPETHDGEIPGLNVNDIPATPIQSSAPKKLLPGVVTPDSQPQIQSSAPKKLLPGVVTPGSQPQVVSDVPLDTVQPGPNDVLVTVPKDIDSDHQPTVVITPLKLPGSSSVTPVIAQPIDSPDQSQILLPGKDNDSNGVIPSKGPISTTHQPKDIDNTVPTKVSGIAHPPITNVVNPTVPEATQTPEDDQTHVVITPLKLPTNQANLGSAPVGQDYVVQTPLNLQPDDTVQQTLVPKSIDNNSNGPKNVPPMLLSGPKQPTQVGPGYSTNQPTITQQPTNQDHLLTPDVIAPPRLQTQSPDLLINPLTHPGNEPKPESLPTSYNIPCDNDVPGVNSGLLTLSPSPDLTTVHQNDSPLLTLNNGTPQPDHSTLLTTPGVVNPNPVQQVDNPSGVVGPPSNKPTFVSHQITPNVNDLDNNPDLLKTNTAPNHLQIQPPCDHTVHSIPASFGVPKPTPVIQEKPMFEFTPSSQPNNGVVHNIPTTSPDVSKPVPLSNQPNNGVIHSIPTTSDVPKPVPILSDKPMFTLDQSKPNLVSHQITPNTIDSGNNPNHLLTNTTPDKPMFGYPQSSQPNNGVVHSLPTTSNVPKPVPVSSDKPMFTLDQPKPNVVSHQITPNTVNSGNNPNLLLPNTAPNHLQLQPTGDQTVHSIPPCFGVTKPAPVLQDKPMFGFDQNNHPSTTIPATFGINSQPVAVKDEPMFSVSDSPSLLQPKHINNDDSRTPTPLHTVANSQPNQLTSQPEPIVDDSPSLLQPNQINNDGSRTPTPLHTVANSQPNQLTSQPEPIVGDSPSLLQPNQINNDGSRTPTPLHTVANSHPVQLTSQPEPIVDDSPSLLQPNQINNDDSRTPTPLHTVANSHPVQLTSQPDDVNPANTIPDSHTIQSSNPVVDQSKQITLASQPDTVPLSTTIPDSHTIQLPNPVADNSKPVQLASQPNTVPLTSTVPDSHTIQLPNPVTDTTKPVTLASQPNAASLPTTIPDSHATQQPIPVADNSKPVALTSQPTDAPPTTVQPAVQQLTKAPSTIDHDIPSQPTTAVTSDQAPKVSAQPIQQVPTPPAYTPSNFMAPNYMPCSPALGYSFAHRYPQYLHNCSYKPPNTYYHPEELIPGFTFGSHIQLYD